MRHVLFDDQRANAAATDAGLIGVWFDITDGAASVVRIRAALGCDGP